MMVSMKILTARNILLITSLMVAGMVTTPALRAADDKAEKKAKRDAANLKKYDKNGNGKLDPDEEAQMKADQAKAKEAKKAKGK
jgi:spore coat protein CotF